MNAENRAADEAALLWRQADDLTFSEYGIRISGSALGRPKKDKRLTKLFSRLNPYEEKRLRNEIILNQNRIQ